MAKLALEGNFGGAAATTLRHSSTIHRIAVSPDDRMFVAIDSGHPAAATAWDLSTGDELWTFPVRVGLTAVAISADGTRVAIAGYDHRAIVLDARTGRQVASFETKDAPRAMTFSPDGAWLLVADSKTPRLFSLEGKEHRALKGHRHTVYGVAFSPDGKLAATSGSDWKTKIQDVAKARVLATREGGCAGEIAFVDVDPAPPDHLHSRLYDLPKGVRVRLLTVEAGENGAISGNRQRVALPMRQKEPRGVIVRDPATRATLLDRAFHYPSAVALDHTGERLVIAGSAIQVWSTKGDGERLLPRMLEGHTGPVTGIATYRSEDGRPIAVSAASDRTLKIWDAEAGVEIETLDVSPRSAEALALTPDGREAFTAADFERKGPPPRRWDLHGMRLAGELSVGDLGDARALAISPDGSLVAASFGRDTAIFDRKTGTPRVILEKTHWHQVDAITFSLDGKYVLTGSDDHLVRAWDLRGKPVCTVAGHTAFVYALAPLPDGTCVSAARELLHFDIATGDVLTTAPLESRSLAASPDGNWLVAVPFDQPYLELYSLRQRLTGPVDKLATGVVPTVVTFLDSTTVLVGTKRGEILRVRLTGS